MSDSDRGAGTPALIEKADNTPGGNQAAKGDNASSNQQTGPIAATVKQTASPNVATPAKPQTQTEQHDQHAFRDLIAQESMADASIFMAWAAIGTLAITAIGTFFLAWQVKLTRKAVEDTGEATKAMVRQNELTEVAQRPWLAIHCVPQKLTVGCGTNGTSVGVKIDINTKNLGKMPAINFQLRFKFLWSESGAFDEIEKVLDDFDPGSAESRKTVFPQDIETFRYWSHATLSERAFGQQRRVYGIFVVSAFYKTNADSKDWCRTDQAYALGWYVDGQFTSSIRPVDASFGNGDLALESMLSATLAD